MSEFENPRIMAIWSFACRFIAPPALTVILVFGIIASL
jgi:hypothetical protein